MTRAFSLTWCQFPPEIVLSGVCWYLGYALSCRDVEALLLERGRRVDHTTVFRWVQRYTPEIDRRSRRHFKPSNNGYRLLVTQPENEEQDIGK